MMQTGGKSYDKDNSRNWWNDAIRKSFDIKKVSSSHSKKKTEIISEEAIDEDKLRAVIDETGYTVLSVDSEPYKKKGFGFFK